MTHIAATALTDVEYNGKNGRAFAKKGTVIFDLTAEEYLALESLKAVSVLSREAIEVPTSHVPSATVPSRFRRNKRER